MQKLLLLLTITLLSCQNNNVEKAVSIFSESENKAYGLHLYPSTMRMVNLNDAPQFNDLIKDVEKLEYYLVNDISESELKDFSSILEDHNYIEMASFQSKGTNATVYAPEKIDDHQYFILMELDGKHQLVRVQGIFNPLKIFELTDSFASGDVLDIFSLMETRQNFNGEKRGRRRNRD